MEAIKIKGRIGPDLELTWLESIPQLRAGEVEVILLYTDAPEKRPPVWEDWPTLDGGRYLGGALRREEIYDDAR